MSYALHAEVNVETPATAAAVFALLDDQEALGAHMTKSSAMMAGGRMQYAFDAERGHAVGSVIRMRGKMLGLELSVEEVVAERTPPTRKVLETRGPPKLVVIDGYRLGFEIDPIGARSKLRVFIDYNLPPGPLGFLAGLPAHFYARWCVSAMAGAAVQHFGSKLTMNESNNAST
jgi:hypothetical protein